MTSLGAYTTTYNCYEMNYPFQESLQSMLGFADEVVVVDAGSTDGTIEELFRIAKQDQRVKVFIEPVDFSHLRWAIHMDGFLKAKSRAKCNSDYLWQMDTDEVVVEHDYERIRLLPEVLHETMNSRPVVFMPMVEFWGSFERMRADFLSWKPRFSKNDSRITHGIPVEYRMVDKYGNEYPRPFESDSCNYIWGDSHESVPMLIPMKVEKFDMNQGEFHIFFHEALRRFPSVLHVSWLDLRRKLEHYKKFWPSFHASMYNFDDPDMPEKNVMFEKRWSEVTHADIASKVEELKDKGPYFFGSKRQRRQSGATISYGGPIPLSLKQWADKVS